MALGEARGVVASACGYRLGVAGRSAGGLQRGGPWEGGGARRLLQVCSQFDQQTAAAAATNAGVVVGGDGLVPAAGSGC